MKILNEIIKQYVGLLSYKTSQRIVVIESDDWGSQRTPNKAVLRELIKFDPTLSNDRFTCLDSIAQQDDLSLLFEILSSVKDKNGNHCAITANVCVANPDFFKIKQSGFKEFFYERFDSTIQKYPDGNKILELWEYGKNNRLFWPQLHGREHVHALAWLEELKAGNTNLLKAFEYEVCSIPYKPLNKQRRRNLMAALDIYNLPGEEEFQARWVIDSAGIFKDSFGYSADTFIAPAYIWHKRIFPILKDANIKAVQGLPVQYEPKNSINGGFSKKLHISGSKTRNGILKLSRNVFFEPSVKPHFDWTDKVLGSIKKAFDTRQPAIIGSHRINYIGSLNSDNRDKNLKTLKTLLNKIINLWPDVQFLTSDQLSKIILQKGEA